MAVAARVGEPLQRAARRRPRPSRCRRRRRRTPCSGRRRRGRAAGRTPTKIAGRGHHGHAAGQREVALAGAQRLDGEVQGDQRGGAGGVDGDGGALEAEGVGDPAGEHAGGGAGAARSPRRPRPRSSAGRRSPGRVAPTNTPVRLPRSVARVDAGALERLPGGLQQQPLLRVHGQRLARRDAEERGVEVGRRRRGSRPRGRSWCRGCRVGVVQASRSQPRSAGKADGVAAVEDEPPQLLGGRDAAGEPAGGRRRSRSDRRRVRAGATRSRRRSRAGRRPGLPRRCSASPPGVGWSKTGVGWQAQPGGRGEPVAQLDRGQRVEAEVPEGLSVAAPRRWAEPEDGGDLGAARVRRVPGAARRR